MRYQHLMALAVSMVILLPAAFAQEHHRNYDDADLDLIVLYNFIESALETINKTLDNVLSDDLEGALLSSSEYSHLVIKAEETIDKIPSDVDSYPYLRSFIGAMLRTESNLTSLTKGMEIAIEAMEPMKDYNLTVWTLRSIEENLTSVDKAIIDFDTGISEMKEGSSRLSDDLRNMDSRGISVENQIELCGQLPNHIDRVAENRTNEEDVISKTMVHPIERWDTALKDLISEKRPGKGLEQDISILDIVVPGLSGRLHTPLDTRTSVLDEVDSSVWSFSLNQSSFLNSMEVLESSGLHWATPLVQFNNLDNARKALEIMDDEMKDQWDGWNALYDHDPGYIEDDLLSLMDLIESYRERLDLVDVALKGLNDIADLLNRTLWANAIDLDPNEDGEVSPYELDNAEFEEEPFILLERARSLLTELEEGVEEIEVERVPELTAMIHELKELKMAVHGFTELHSILLQDLKELVSYTRGPADIFVRAMRSYTSAYQFLEESDERSLGVVDMNVTMNRSSFPSLYNMMDLYGGLLTDASEGMGPALVLTLSRSEIPYDSSMGIRVLLLDPAEEENGPYPDGRFINISLDGMGITSLETQSGLAIGSLFMNRSMFTGMHEVSASTILGNGTVLRSNSTFALRRIRTSLLMDATGRLLDIGQDTDLSVRLLDEFGRSVPEPITLENQSVIPEGSGSVRISFDRYGTQVAQTSFNGTGHFSGSRGFLSFNVSTDPVLDLSVEERTLKMNRTIRGTVNLTHAQGKIGISLGNLSIGLGVFDKGDMTEVEINTSVMGPGVFRMRAHVRTNVPWVRSGASNSVTIYISAEDEGEGEVGGDDDIDDDDIEDDDIDDDDETGDDPPEEKDDEEERLQWLIFIIIILAATSLVVFTVLRRRKKKVTGKDDDQGFRLPKLYTGIILEEEEKEEDAEEEDEKRTEVERASPTRKTEKEGKQNPPVKKVDPNRLELIRTYIAMIERSPEDFGLKKSYTPREVCSKLIDLGFDPDISRRMTDSFETNVYSNMRPEMVHVKEFSENVSKVSSWFSRVKEKVGSLMGRERDSEQNSPHVGKAPKGSEDISGSISEKREVKP